MNGTRIRGETRSASVIGCGYLGFPLARLLVADGLSVMGSSTTRSKLPLLAAAGISAHHLDLKDLIQSADGDDDLVQRGATNDFDDLFESDAVVVNIPPGRRDPERQSNYAVWMRALAARIARGSYVIFASSTSVYPDDIEVADVDSAAPHSAGASTLLEAERVFENHEGGSSIVRFGGLYGYERRAGRFFAGRQQIPGGDAPVNMIHRDDAVDILRRLVHSRPETGRLNACAPRHPSRSEFYTQWARRDGLDIPTWDEKSVGGKLVRTTIPDDLGFEFAYPDPMMPAP